MRADRCTSRKSCKTRKNRKSLMGLALLLALALGTGNAPAALAEPGCAYDIDLSQPIRLLFDRETDVVKGVFGFYEGECDGVLYLVDLDDPVHNAVNESWRLYRLESVGFAEGRRDRIVVDASYVTGIGPGGAEPFRARIVMNYRTGARWTPEGSDPDDGSAGPAEPDASVREASSAEALQALEIRSDRGQLELAPDFATSRAVVKSIWLTSGSAEIDSVRIHRTDDAYLVFYRVKSPRLGTTDMKQSLIYLELPRDGLPVAFLDRRSNVLSGRRVEVPYRVIDSGTMAGAPPP